MNKWLKGRGLDGIPWKECFNPVKMLNVGQGFLFYFLFPPHVFEQYVVRFYDDECKSKCYDSPSGECYTCGCHARAKAWAPLEKCSNNNWYPIIWNKEEYSKMRAKSPIDIKIIYKKMQSNV